MKRIDVVGAVLVRDGKILAAQRSESMSLPLTWEFPGGKIEPGESPVEALRRELQEELLCNAIVGEHVETTEHEYDFGTVVLSTYFCTLDGADPQITEHAQIRWMEADQLLELQWAPADVPAVRKIMDQLGR